MNDQDWNSSWIRCLGMFLAGNVPNEIDEKGIPLADDSLILILNSHHEMVRFVIPASLSETAWEVMIDTHHAEPGEVRVVKAGEPMECQSRSLILLKAKTAEQKK
jgi:glycogen operon protein